MLNFIIKILLLNLLLLSIVKYKILKSKEKYSRSHYHLLSYYMVFEMRKGTRESGKAMMSGNFSFFLLHMPQQGSIESPPGNFLLF